MPARVDASDGTDDQAQASAGVDDGDPDVPDVTRFERAFLDHPVARDLVLFGFLAGFYGGGMWLALPFSLPASWAVGMGVAFAVGWLALMEASARLQGASMLRSLGTDPYAPLLEGDER